MRVVWVQRDHGWRDPCAERGQRQHQRLHGTVYHSAERGDVAPERSDIQREWGIGIGCGRRYGDQG